MEVNKLYKPIINDVINGEHKVRVCSIKLPTLKNGMVKIKTSPSYDYFTRYVTSISDSKNKELASYVYDFDYYDNNIDGMYMEVNNIKNRRNGSGLGELLRLISIIEMLENKFDSIKLFSKDTAIYFHSKYGFKAEAKDFSTQIRLLKIIAEDNSGLMHKVSSKAKNLLNIMLQEDLPPVNCRYTKSVNEVINDYIKLAQNSDNPYTEHGLRYGVYMDLTKKDVLKKRKFFNNLFKKHNIDYTI